MKLNAVNNLFVGILAGTFIVLLCTIGSLHVADGRITLGDFVAYLIYAQMIIGPIGMLSGIYIEVQKAMAAVSRIFGILDLESEPEGGHTSEVGSGTGRRNREAVRIDDLSFSYEPGVRILEGISLSIAKGESVAFVGPSGAGKSTLLKLLLRFYESEKGAIRLFGRPLDEYEGSELRGKVAAVMQDTHLFDMSVRENILCGNPEASDRDVERAARAAHALRFIRDLPDGFETRLGENGVRLSGGQRQRISIARAFLKDPAILLLDEATASLDAEAERHIQSSLHRLMKRRTTIAIAHRLSTIRRVDRIFVMSEGTIIAQGTHESLMRECPLYAELCRHQMLG